MEEIFWKIFEKTGSISSYLAYSQLKSGNGVEVDDKSETRASQNSTHSGGSAAIHQL